MNLQVVINKEEINDHGEDGKEDKRKMKKRKCLKKVREMVAIIHLTHVNEFNKDQEIIVIQEDKEIKTKILIVMIMMDFLRLPELDFFTHTILVSLLHLQIQILIIQRHLSLNHHLHHRLNHLDLDLDLIINTVVIIVVVVIVEEMEAEEMDTIPDNNTHLLTHKLEQLVLD